MNKSRKLGYTMLWMMESITLACMNDKTFYPFVATTETQASRAIGIAEQLIADAVVDVPIERVNASQVEFKNGSKIEIFSGNSPESARGPQAYSAGLDEFAFGIYQKELLSAFSPMLVQGGQLTIISTPNGVNNEYWKYVDKARSNPKEYAYIEQAVWKDSNKFNVHLAIADQISEGLQTVAWWIDPYKLEQDRLRDEVIFMQEYCCQASESSYALFNRDNLLECVVDGKYEDGKDPINTYFSGSDFALSTQASGDFSVTVVGKYIDGVVEIIFVDRHKGLDTPAQVDRLELLFHTYKPVTQGVEENSFGKSIFDYLKKKVPVVVPYHTSEQSKRTYIRQLQEFIKNKKLRIRKGETYQEKEATAQWLKEMMSFSRIENRQGTNYKLEGAGEHDDCVMATGIMLQAVVDWMGGMSSKVEIRASPPNWGPSNTTQQVEESKIKQIVTRQQFRKSDDKREERTSTVRIVKW